MMGNPEHLNFSRKDLGVRSCTDVLIVAASHSIESASWLSETEAFPGLVVHACENTAAVPIRLAKAASLVVLEIDPHSRASMHRLHELKLACPNLPVVAAIADASISLVRALVREGVVDVVSLPFQFEEVLETAADALASTRRQADQGAALAPMLAVVRSTGGCGATSIATHLVAQLGELDESGKKVAIVDLDLQFGNVASFLSGEGRGSIDDLIKAEERLDDQLIESVARHFSDKVDIFAAPDEIMPLETINTEALLKVIEMLRRQYAYVVLDLPANWTNWTLSAVAACDQIVMVVELSIASLRQAKRRLDLFSSVGISPRKVQIVANRIERRLFRTIDLADVAKTLGHEVLGSIVLEESLVSAAQDQGLLTGQVHRKSRFAADVAKLAEQLAERLNDGDRS
jgi:pilus assembly protein CpaE